MKMSPQSRNPIKILSTIMIASAVGLEIADIYTISIGSHLPGNFQILIWLGRLAIGSHFLEAIFAAYQAKSRGETPLNYSIYTFFVGTVALLELFEKEKISLHQR